MHQHKLNHLYRLFIWTAIVAFPNLCFGEEPITFIGINKLSPQFLHQIDNSVEKILINYEYISLAVVKNGNIVLTKCYNKNRLNNTDVYASVSKPVTATILFQLINENKISSIDDDIGRYHDKYRNCVPDKYGESFISFKNLLCHTSGVPHQSKLWDGSKLRLEFQPGSNAKYSTHGYGILGNVMEEITGKTYKNLVKEYIGKPVNAKSFTVMHPFFDAPAGQVTSTIEDMARFALGVMNEKYFPKNILLTQILREHARINDEIIGFGWFVTNLKQSNLAGYHAGSNGKPRAFLAIRPNQENAIALIGRNKISKGAHDFGSLTIELMEILDSDR